MLALFTRAEVQAGGSAIAPVSPVPEFATMRVGDGERTVGLADVVGGGEGSRSRISSVASGNGLGLGEGMGVGETRKGSVGGTSQISPVDRSFLLGYLENVVKGGTVTGR